MKNPFSYSNIVTGEAFCNRQAEMADLMRRIDDGQNVLLFSHRRTGKTSLIHQLIQAPRFAKHERRSRKGRHSAIRPLVIDLFGTLSESDFVAALLSALGQLENSLDRLAARLKGFHLAFSVDPVSGLPVVTPGFAPTEAPAYLERVMEVYAAYSAKERLLVVLDEFQEVERYAEPGFEKRLRKSIQKRTNISYIFAGSKHHLLELMFNSPGRAFYRMARHFPLKPIPLEHYQQWAVDLFTRKGVELSETVVAEIVARCDHHPAYVQQFLSELWHADPPNSAAVEEIGQALLSKNQEAFLKEWDLLTLNQKKTLKLIVTGSGKGVYSGTRLLAVGFNSPGTIQRTLKSLIEKDIVRKNDGYALQDPLFRQWLERRFEAYPVPE